MHYFHFRTSSAHRPVPAAFAVCAALMVGGCGGVDVGDVSGTITYNGALVKSGSITIMTEKGSAQANIKEDGTYTVANVPVGGAKVTVVCNDDARMLQQVQEASAKGRGAKLALANRGTAQENFSLIPEIYGDLTKTPLQTIVKAGKNTYDVKLTQPQEGR